MAKQRTNVEADVLVVGAGIAGLAAARVLAEAGRRVIVLEARERVGGRVHTEHVGNGLYVEHGAEFIHGREPQLWALIEESGLEAVERSGASLEEQVPGRGMASDRDDETDDAFAETFEELASWKGEDLSFAEWLQRSHVPREVRSPLIGYTEGFNAADTRRISAKSLGIQQTASDEIDGERSWHLTEGYARLPEFIAERVRAAGGEIRLNCEVSAIRWRPGEAVVSTRDGDFRSPRCVVALPLGVLQAANASAPHSVRIEPEPRPLFEARRMAMGEVVRFTMAFRDRWWEHAPAPDPRALAALSFAMTRERMPPVWWTRHPEQESVPTLVGWSGGPRSAALRGKGAAELGELACRELAAAFRVDEAEVRKALVSTHTYDWSNDPFARGSYSYVVAGALDAPHAMTVPEFDTLYFAGEHTDTTGHWGTVHAALLSGLRGAGQVIADGSRDFSLGLGAVVA